MSRTGVCYSIATVIWRRRFSRFPSVQTERYVANPTLAREVGPALVEWARTHDPDELLILSNPLGSGKLRIASRPIGPHAELGVITAAFADRKSPTAAHHLDLNVAASQAAIGIANTRLLHSLGESEKRAREAHQELTERLGELQKVNVELQDARRAALNIMEDALAARQEAEHAAAALRESETRRTAFLEQLRKRGERQQLLSDALARLLSARDRDTIVRELFSKVAAHLGADTYFNFMVNESGDGLRLHSYAGIAEESARAIERLEFGQAICGTVAQTRQPLHATDIQHSDFDASGYLEPELKLEIDQAGVRYFLHKPYMPEDIIKTLQSLLAGKP